MHPRHTIVWNITATLLIILVLILGAWSIYHYDRDAIPYRHNALVMGNHTIITTTATLGRFTRLDIHGEFNVIVEPGNMAQISLQADSNILPLIEVGIMDGTLNIHVPRTIMLRPSVVPTITLTAPILDEIRLGGKTTLTITKLTLTDLTVSLSGQSTANISGTIANTVINLGGASTLNAQINHGKTIALINGGDSTVNLSGSAQLLAITSAGKALINAKHLIAQQVTLTSAGYSSVSVNATNSLDVTATGHSEIHYYGHPKAVTKTGFGHIKFYPEVLSSNWTQSHAG